MGTAKAFSTCTTSSWVEALGKETDEKAVGLGMGGDTAWAELDCALRALPFLSPREVISGSVSTSVHCGLTQ
jgi:hypothetical protein